MSLCTSIPATRSYITFMRRPPPAAAPPYRWEQGAPPARAPDQYRRLTHAHAAATGVTRQGAPAPILTTASNGPRRNGDDGRHASTTVHLPPRPPPPDHRQKPRPPTTRTRQRRKGTLEHAHDVGLFHDQQVLPVDLHFGAGPFAEQDAVAGFDFRDNTVALFVAGAGADGDDFAFLRLFLSGIGDDDATPAVLVSSCTRFTTTRSPSGRNFMRFSPKLTMFVLLNECC